MLALRVDVGSFFSSVAPTTQLTACTSWADAVGLNLKRTMWWMVMVAGAEVGEGEKKIGVPVPVPGRTGSTYITVAAELHIGQTAPTKVITHLVHLCIHHHDQVSSALHHEVLVSKRS